jgi:hypothetical protein
MTASFEWFVLELYYLYNTTILPILKPVAILFFTILTPPPKKKTQQIKDPLQANFATKIDLIWW